jgi:hypothetical protein
VVKIIDKIKDSARSLLSWLKSALDIRDFLLFGGLVLLGYGLWLYAPWLGFAVPGAILTAFGIFIWILGLFVRRPT